MIIRILTQTYRVIFINPLFEGQKKIQAGRVRPISHERIYNVTGRRNYVATVSMRHAHRAKGYNNFFVVVDKINRERAGNVGLDEENFIFSPLLFVVVVAVYTSTLLLFNYPLLSLVIRRACIYIRLRAANLYRTRTITYPVYKILDSASFGRVCTACLDWKCVRLPALALNASLNLTVGGRRCFSYIKVAVSHGKLQLWGFKAETASILLQGFARLVNFCDKSLSLSLTYPSLLFC